MPAAKGCLRAPTDFRGKTSRYGVQHHELVYLQQYVIGRSFVSVQIIHLPRNGRSIILPFRPISAYVVLYF